MSKNKIAVPLICLIIIISSITIIVEISSRVTGITIYVDDDYGSEDPTHKKTIISAIENASNGDTIIVYNGEYMGDEMGWLAIDKSVNIIGQSNENTIIKDTFVLFASENIDFSFFKFQGCLVETYFNNIIINYCNFTSFSFLDIYSSYVWILNSSIIERGYLWTHGASYVYIENSYMNNTQYPLWISSSSNIFITNSNLHYLDNWGVYPDQSTNIVMKNTAILSDEGGIGISWGSLTKPEYYNHSIDTSNTINGKPVYYYYNKTNLVLTGLDAGHITLALCSNITLKDSIASRGDGLITAFSSNLNITNNNISSNLGTNIYMTTSSHYNNFTNNIILGAGSHGIRFYDSSENNFINNTIKSNSFGGIFVDRYSINNTISECTISNNDRGLMVRGGYNNFTDNLIEDNNLGIWLLFDLSINNYFINNSLNNIGTEFYLDQGPNAYVINTTFNKSRIACREIDESFLVVQWFLHVNIIDYLGNPIPNANVWVKDNENGSFSRTYITGPDGYTKWNIITEFWQNKTNKIEYSPYNIIAWNDTLVGYAQPIMNESKTVTIVLYNGTLLDLEPGWNLVSLPRIQSDTNLSTVLQSIDGQYDAVQWYNITDSNDPWKHNHISKPSNWNDLNEINHTMGVWVHVTDPGGTTLVVFGDVLTSTQNITLYPGWNLVGYPSTTDKIRISALNNIFFDTEVDAIWTHNATTQTWKEITTSDNFEVGMGYWIHSKVTKTWIVPL